MKTLGWIFLICYLIDAVVSTVATYVPGASLVSSAITNSMVVFSIVVFVLAMWGKLLPRKVFLMLTLYYAVLALFGIVLIALMIFKYGVEEFTHIAAAATSGSRLFRGEFAWFDIVHLPMLCTWLGLAIYGLVTYGKTVQQTQTSATDVSPG